MPNFQAKVNEMMQSIGLVASLVNANTHADEAKKAASAATTTASTAKKTATSAKQTAEIAKDIAMLPAGEAEFTKSFGSGNAAEIQAALTAQPLSKEARAAERQRAEALYEEAERELPDEFSDFADPTTSKDSANIFSRLEHTMHRHIEMGGVMQRPSGQNAYVTVKQTNGGIFGEPTFHRSMGAYMAASAALGERMTELERYK